ncbi:FtsB family cell division protein [Novosphingopyxis baekryungensis]|uniref:FtsB family cell division protein n=1 Tax=Novosphingopyxis baekryungensis TaxID=279369 RepID=UPI0003B74CFC|nr:septum formation initiator family protein [Novosphingopyxis baekryungensis]
MVRRPKILSLFLSALSPGLALMALLAIAAYAMLGPTGILAWTDYKAGLAERQVELSKLQEERDALRNRARLLDGDRVDPDLAGELMRKELGVAAPDEIIVPLDQ